MYNYDVLQSTPHMHIQLYKVEQEPYLVHCTIDQTLLYDIVGGMK